MPVDISHLREIFPTYARAGASHSYFAMQADNRAEPAVAFCDHGKFLPHLQQFMVGIETRHQEKNMLKDLPDWPV